MVGHFARIIQNKPYLEFVTDDVGGANCRTWNSSQTTWASPNSIPFQSQSAHISPEHGVTEWRSRSLTFMARMNFQELAALLLFVVELYNYLSLFAVLRFRVCCVLLFDPRA